MSKDMKKKRGPGSLQLCGGDWRILRRAVSEGDWSVDRGAILEAQTRMLLAKGLLKRTKSRPGYIVCVASETARRALKRKYGYVLNRHMLRRLWETRDSEVPNLVIIFYDVLSVEARGFVVTLLKHGWEPSVWDSAGIYFYKDIMDHEYGLRVAANGAVTPYPRKNES